MTYNFPIFSPNLTRSGSQTSSYGCYTGHLVVAIIACSIAAIPTLLMGYAAIIAIHSRNEPRSDMALNIFKVLAGIAERDSPAGKRSLTGQVSLACAIHRM